MCEKVILQLLVTTRDIPICIYIHINYLPVHNFYWICQEEGKLTSQGKCIGYGEAFTMHKRKSLSTVIVVLTCNEEFVKYHLVSNMNNVYIVCTKE